jgi:uncharacterized protein (TIGR03435 family)
VNHLWQSTVFGGVVLLLNLALRRNAARVRYWLWFAASMKFVIPFSLLVALGSHVHLRGGTAPATTLPVIFEQLAAPLPALGAVSPVAPDRSAPINPLPILAAIWACGVLTIAFRWSREWLRVRRIIDSARPADLDLPIEAVFSTAMIEPGVFGIFRPVLVLPEGITDRLSPDEFGAILAHELSHVRRRDNLFAAMHMAVEAAFWFHPLVWWVGNRLVEERERACDEDVLRQGSEPQAYAEGILKVCEHYLGVPLPCAAGVSGADLRKRIEGIMASRDARALTRARKLLLSGVAILTLALPVAVGSLTAPSLRAQATEARPAFEVASVKVNASGAGLWRIYPPSGNRFRATNVTLDQLIQTSYRLLPFQVSGGPSWLNSERFDIEAKSEGDAALTLDQERLMLQRLLEDRFRLKLHRETSERAIYELQIAKGGIKFKEGKCVGEPGPTNPCGGFSLGTRGKAAARVAEMPGFASLLAGYLGRVVIDKTNLAGKYDFDLTWTPDENMPKGPGDAGQPPADPDGPSLFTALQEQLGLKLEAAKGPVEILVVDHSEKPTGD